MSPQRSAVIVPWAVAAVLALVAATLAVLLLVGDDDEDLGSTARSSADGACELLDDLPDRVDLDDSDEVGQLQARLGAVSTLAMLAMRQDKSYSDLSEAVDRMRGVFAEQFSIEGEAFDDAKDRAEDECDELD